jgi:exosortase B
MRAIERATMSAPQPQPHPLAQLLPPAPWRATLRLRPLALMLAALAVLAAPTLWALATQVWQQDEQGHGPVILAVSLWLMAGRRQALQALPARSAPGAAAVLLMLGWACVVMGRSQAVLPLEALGLWPCALAVLLLHRGWPALRLLAVPLVALLFAVPLPGVLVQTVTLPLKLAVSQAAEAVLHLWGYPVARSGVMLAIDQYRLLVADACAGLASMFTLEAMGLLYLQLRGPAAAWRDATLAVLLVPLALLANVVRVVVLVLVTYHLGDAAGRGLLHGAAGVLLFGVAMVLMLLADRALAGLQRLLA